MKNKLQEGRLECGTDEAGRGCLAGPVTAAAVILPEDFSHPLLQDSKALTRKQRLEIEPLIQEKAISFAIIHILPEEIDRVNILQASVIAMQEAIEKLEPQPEFIAVDGNYFKDYKNIPYETIVKGDAKYLHIAAASILAKNARDRFMEELHEDYPEYDWVNNKGYPTKNHREGIRKHGATPHHRKSFKLLPEQLELDI